MIFKFLNVIDHDLIMTRILKHMKRTTIYALSIYINLEKCDIVTNNYLCSNEYNFKKCVFYIYYLLVIIPTCYIYIGKKC